MWRRTLELLSLGSKSILSAAIVTSESTEAVAKTSGGVAKTSVGALTNVVNSLVSIGGGNELVDGSWHSVGEEVVGSKVNNNLVAEVLGSQQVSVGQVLEDLLDPVNVGVDGVSRQARTSQVNVEEQDIIVLLQAGSSVSARANRVSLAVNSSKVVVVKVSIG